MKNSQFDLLVRKSAAENDPGLSAVDAASRRLDRVLVVLDDDPTGTQSVADLPVLTAWDVSDFEWAFATNRPAVYVLTNTRSMGEADAVRIQGEVVQAAYEAADRLQKKIAFVSRGDSTLRGHFPAETDALRYSIQSHADDVDGILVVPAFPEAGRVTFEGTHWLRGPDQTVPLAETEFAQDATFGYRSSDIAEWIEEKSAGRIAASSTVHLDLATVRMGPEAVAAILGGVRGGQHVYADAVNGADLRSLALGCVLAEQDGTRLLYRSGPPFVRDLIGQAVSPPVMPLASATHLTGGLIVIGSHVGVTAGQLGRLREGAPEAAVVELSVDDALSDNAGVIETLASRVSAGLFEGPVILQTARELRRGSTPEESLEIARRVSDALVRTVREVIARGLPAFVLAKGGITSSDVATKGLQIRHAMIRGSLLPGIVSLWHALDGTRRRTGVRGLPRKCRRRECAARRCPDPRRSIPLRNRHRPNLTISQRRRCPPP